MTVAGESMMAVGIDASAVDTKGDSELDEDEDDEDFKDKLDRLDKAKGVVFEAILVIGGRMMDFLRFE